jgi:hypothetical protein
MVTGKGTFNPPIGGIVGGDNTPGTTLALAFDGVISTSGIGTYVLTANATDVAENPNQATKTFKVSYDFFVTKSPSSGHNSNPQIHFTAKRSTDTSDGKFMFDETVVVQLWQGSTMKEQHGYGTASLTSEVQIDTTGSPFYKTQFHGLANGTYTIRVFFRDIDGNLMEQGTGITFTIS